MKDSNVYWNGSKSTNCTTIEVFWFVSCSNPMVPSWMVTLSLVGAALWLISIQIGLYHNIKSANIAKIHKIREHIVILLITPLATLIDTGIAFFTILKWSLGFNKAVWEVTPKRLQT